MQNDLVADLEASRPDYMVFVDVATSWLPRPHSPTRFFDWWHSYVPQQYTAVGVAEIISPEHTEYRWDGVATYRAGAHPAVWIYKRNGT
jgi:hypothetical protein